MTALQRARLATSITYAGFGFLFATWATRIPEVKHSLGLSPASLGLALLAPACGGLLTARAFGRACARYGSARATRIAIVGMCLLAWAPGLAWNLETLIVALFLWGLTIGAQDVSMNAQGVTVESAYRRPVMSGLHASFSIGTFFGVGVGALGAQLAIPIALQQAVLGAVQLAILLPVSHYFLPDPFAATDASGPVGSDRRLRIDVVLLSLGVGAAFAFMAEGAVADWSGVFLRESFHAARGQVGFAFAAFSLAMTAGRLTGDRVVHRLGRARALAAFSVFGSTGLFLGLAIGTLATTVAGFAAVGLGLSVLVPIFFSTTAETAAPGPAIGVVSSFAYAGFLLGPSLVGFTAQTFSVRGAMWLIPFATLTAGVLGRVALHLNAKQALRTETRSGEPASMTD